MITGPTIAHLLALAGLTAVPGLATLPLEFTTGPSYPAKPSGPGGQRKAKRAAAKRRNQARNRRAQR